MLRFNISPDGEMSSYRANVNDLHKSLTCFEIHPFDFTLYFIFGFDGVMIVTTICFVIKLLGKI